MANPAGETTGDVLRVDFDRRLMVQFRGSVVTSDAGLLAYRELDDALGLSALAREMLADARTGKNGRHALVGLLRQSVFGRLAGYEDVNDAERLRHDPAMRWIIGGNAAYGRAASPSQMGRFETQWLATDTNLAGLIDLSGQWIDLVHRRRPSRSIVLDMDSSVSPTHGEQELSVWNGLGYMWNPRDIAHGLANPAVWLKAASQIFFTLLTRSRPIFFRSSVRLSLCRPLLLKLPKK